MLPLLCLSLVVGALAAPSTVCPSHCQDDHKPVCGTNGITYENGCKLDMDSCQNLRIGKGPIYVKSTGRCASSSVSRLCDMICDEQEVKFPICASNSVVYDNQCRFNRAKCDAMKNGTILYIVSYKDSCPVPVAPDCDKYYKNTTDAAIEGALGDPMNTVCPRTFNYVCTTDGTFSNECDYCGYIKSLKSHLGQNFKASAHVISHNGRCPDYFPDYVPGAVIGR